MKSPRAKARHLDSIEEVVAYQLCSGCGVCTYLEPQRYAMVDATEHGRRPAVVAGAAPASGVALSGCPGVALQREGSNDPEQVSSLRDIWGPVYAVWEGHAAATDLRFAGSSGGAATALALYCLEQGLVDGVLHTAARPDVPYLNETVRSTSRAALLAAAGSRYAPASPCERLDLIEKASGCSLFIGKPCDVAAVQRARRHRPLLDVKLRLTIAFFCAGTPSTSGTLALMRSLGISEPSRVKALRFRGHGWPGRFTVEIRNDAGADEVHMLSYADSWGFLQKYRPWRCYICPDHTGEFADIAVGDPWYRPASADEPGRSLIVARTPAGRELVRAAAAGGYLRLERCDPSLLPSSQPALQAVRGALWGRLVTLRLMGVRVPDYRGMALFGPWWRLLSLSAKLRSFISTARWVRLRRLRHRLAIAGLMPDA